MRIGISGLSIHGQSKRGGLWEYFRALIKILSEVIDKEEVFVFIPDDLREEFKEFNFKRINFVEIKTVKKGTHYLEIFILPPFLKKYKINLVHFPNYAFPLYQNIPYLVTVHDLAFLKIRENYKKRELLYWNTIYRAAIKNAKVLIAVSNNTKKDLNYFWRIPLKNIKVIPAFSSLLLDNKKEKGREKKTPDFPYFLFVGTLEPRKNVERIIEAFLKASCKIKENVKLILIGQKGFKSESICKKIEENKEKIIWLNNVKNEELSNFYEKAIALIYPSLYEGFGLPVLEAFKFNIPVITSNLSSLPEIASTGSILVNPYSTYEVEKAILDIYYENNLREKILKEQREIIKKYTPHKLGEEILKVYRSLLAL
ncbi:MAG: glycosyltransferase family 1 protein [Candidatus Hydrothermales bacterium]